VGSEMCIRDRAYTILQGQLQEFGVDGGLYERPGLGEQLPTESLVERIAASLPNSVEVWSPPDSVWRRSVFEQVLLIGTGERKDGVKTGAADSVVLACVEDAVQDRRNAEAVVLATNDKRLKAHCARQFGDDVLIAEGTAALLGLLNAFMPAEAELFEETEEALRKAVEDGSSELGAALETFDMGFRIHTSGSGSDGPGRAVRNLARLGRVDIVELHDLQVTGKDSAERVGLAEVRVFATVHMTQLEFQSASTGPSEWVTTYDGPVTHGFVDLRVAVAWDKSWKVQSVSPTGPAVIAFDTSEYDDLDGVPPFHVDE